MLVEQIEAPVIAIMVNWNGKNFLRASLASVLSELNKHKGKLLLIDNNSSDGSVDYVREQFSQVVISQNNENLGGAGGFSCGMKLALQSVQCEFIWLLDNDIVVEENALSHLVNWLIYQENSGAAGSQICLYEKPKTIQEIGSFYSPWLGSLNQCYSGQERLPSNVKPWKVDYLAACSMLIRRKCLEQVGVFEDFFIFYDDVEWGLRAKKLGWTLWAVPASVICHNFSAIKPTQSWREYYRKRNRLVVLSKYPPKQGRYSAALIYLWFLGKLILLNKILGYSSLYYAYLWARQDALQGKLGKRDLSYLNELDLNESKLYFPENIHEILIDVGESPGDALALMQKVRQINPDTILFLPKYLKFYLKFFELGNLCIDNNKNYSMVILGREYRLSSITKSKNLFIYKNGQLINQSHWQCIKYKLIKLVAVVASILVMPYYSLFWFKRFRSNIFERTNSSKK